MTVNEHTRAISMIRGDDETLTLQRLGEDGAPFPFTAGEILTLTVREDAESPVLLQTEAAFNDAGEAVFIIAHENTAGLDFGRFVYDIQYTGPGGRISTYVPLSRFIVQREVTY